MLRVGKRLPYRQSISEKWLRLRVLALLKTQPGQFIQTLSEVRMIGPELLPSDAHRSLVEHRGLAVLSLAVITTREAYSRIGYIPAIRSQRTLENREGAAEKGLCPGIVAG